jgi:suppressor for copper-sensitivity B
MLQALRSPRHHRPVVEPRPGSWLTGARIALATIAMLASAGAAARADGAASDWVRTDQTAVRLVSAVDAVGQADDIRIGLRIDLEPGWKTYWRSPGDAGYPVSVDWAGSANLAGAEMLWPVPHRFSLFGLDTFGYEEQVIFPFRVRPERPGEPIGLRAAVDYLVCSDICIPYQAALALDLPAGPALPTEHAQSIDRFMARVPGDGARHGLTLERVHLAGSAAEPVLEIRARSQLPFDSPDMIVEGPLGLYFSAPKTTLWESNHVAVLAVPISVDEDAPTLPDARLTLTLVDSGRGLEQVVTAGAGYERGGAPAQAAFATMTSVLLLALLGGLILNVMPCVLPVLSLKLLGIVGHARASRARVRLGFLASAAGVLAAFIGLGAALVGVKWAGGAVGWGIQFQQPWFLVAMTLVLTLFAANLWGWFEVPLPAWLGRAASLENGSSPGGQFATGVFATLLATPCSAPFVGTAVGFALAREAGDILAVFAALGVGMAAPYLAIAGLPGLTRFLPRPGRWMIVLRRVLGLLLAATAVWLLTVLAVQIDRAAAFVVGGAVAAATAALWARHRMPDRLRLASPAAVGLLALLAFVASERMAPAPASKEKIESSTLWQTFDEAAIDALVGQGKTVFVDVTAEWCVTCIVNKSLVLESPEVAPRLAAPEVVAMQADWTSPDDRIARYLTSFGRYGIPFNAVYGPGAPDGIVLPELLTKGVVLDALAKAGAG